MCILSDLAMAAMDSSISHLAHSFASAALAKAKVELVPLDHVYPQMFISGAIALHAMAKASFNTVLVYVD